MNIILLSGGSGKRLWPLSNDIRSKQFIQIFKTEDGKYESMLQRVYRQIRAVVPEDVITVATSKAQVSAIRNQLGENIAVCVEPCRKDTFPAMALAAAYLKDIEAVSEKETVVVCPVDLYVEKDFFETIVELEKRADKGNSSLILVGIEPIYPSEKYGYIIPESREHCSKVSAFKEKPEKKAAEKYIEQGALWNSGIFAFKLEYLLQKAHEMIEFEDYEDLYAKYDTLKSISFDYAVAEVEPDREVLRFAGKWTDLGTWNTLSEAMNGSCVGNVILSQTCENVRVINELDVPVLCMGVKDIIISASSEGILVSDKEQSSYIKPYVDQIDQQVMFADKSWGSFRVLDIEDKSMTVKIILKPGCRMNYHSHERRDEVWTIISGTGRTIVDGMEQPVQEGDVIAMQAGCRHTIIADTELTVIEVQLGDEISVHDKKKFELED